MHHYQLEFEFRTKEQREKDYVDAMSKIKDLNLNFYRINKFMDELLDNIPYGWRIYHKTHHIKSWIVSIYQKLRYGVSNKECWNLDQTITKFILPRLKHFKKVNVHSHPANLTEEKWDAILDEIIWTFEYLDNPEKFNPFPYSCAILTSSRVSGKTEKQKQDWKNYVNKSLGLEERKKKGLQLFAEYYENLWD